MQITLEGLDVPKFAPVQKYDGCELERLELSELRMIFHSWSTPAGIRAAVGEEIRKRSFRPAAGRAQKRRN